MNSIAGPHVICPRCQAAVSHFVRTTGLGAGDQLLIFSCDTCGRVFDIRTSAKTKGPRDKDGD